MPHSGALLCLGYQHYVSCGLEFRSYNPCTQSKQSPSKWINNLHPLARCSVDITEQMSWRSDRHSHQWAYVAMMLSVFLRTRKLPSALWIIKFSLLDHGSLPLCSESRVHTEVSHCTAHQPHHCSRLARLHWLNHFPQASIWQYTYHTDQEKTDNRSTGGH